MNRYAVMLIIGVFVLAAGWCAPAKAGLLDSIWEVDVPPAIVEALDLKCDKVKLNQADSIAGRYELQCQNHLDNFGMNITAANNSYAGVGTLVNTLTDIGVGTYFPGGGALAILAAGVAGWIAPPPKNPLKKKSP